MKKENRKEIKKQPKSTSPKALKGLLLVCLFIFAGLTVRIGWIQFVDGAELKEKAYKNQALNRIISPKRGTIYDSTGKALARSASVDTVTINPNKIVVSKEKTKALNEQKTILLKEKVAKGLSDIFELDYNEVLEKVNSDSSVKTIIKKVEQDKIKELKTWMEENDIAVGINIDEDTKRYYPYNNLASQLIGFCGTDNQGLVGGIETKWDSVLTGTPGKIVSSKDAIQEEIPDAEQQYIPPENGSDIVLSIDVKIQTIAEKYLKQAVEENNCKRGGNVLIMNPNTGDILAMATYPDYNLNEPFTPNAYINDNWDNLSTQEKSDRLEKMWRNKAVSDTYEPGSPFKLVTSSVALEEDITKTDIANEFYCSGFEMVAGSRMHCWRSYNPHGSQTLRDALGNSCNPAFIQLSKRIGAPLLYRYYDALGLFNKTGVAISGEANSTFWNLEDVHEAELATMSYGQRFNITPLQMISAISAIANDGILMQPRIVKQVINTDTQAVTNLEPVQVRQVFSKETSQAVRALMQSVVDDGTGGRGSVKGYSVGGKTGTSEASPGREEIDGFVASYVAIAPVENPEVCILVILYQPNGKSYQGGQIAGPVVSQILTEVLPYLGIPSTDSGEGSSSSQTKMVTVNDIRNKTVTEAQKILENNKLTCKTYTTSNRNETLVVDQVPKPGTSIPEGGTVMLYTQDSNTRISVQVPNLKGMSLSQATNSLKSKNLNIEVEGTGRVLSQTPSYQTSVEEGTVVKVILGDDTEDAH